MASPLFSAVKPVSASATLIALSLGICAAAGTRAAAATLVVNPANPRAYQTIQDAIRAAAPSGDLIRVFPGTYSGDNGGAILVDKSVTIRGTGPNDFQTNAPTPGDDDPSLYSVVVNGGQGGFDVAASGVTISRFRIVGSNAAPTYPNAGISLRSGSDRTLNFIVFENNGLGLYVEGSETALDVNSNAFYNNYRGGDPYPSGGIFAPGGPVNSATIRNDRFFGNGQFSMNFGAGSSMGLTISGNTADTEGTFIVIGNTTGARIASNNATNLYSSGVYSSGNNNGLVITQNTLRGVGPTAGRGSGIRMNIAYGNTAGDVSPSINNNTISSFFYDGMGLRDVSGAVVAKNSVSGNGRHGIWLQNVTGSRFTMNTASDNVVTGIRVESVSTGNTLGSSAANGNTLTGNTLDAADMSTGTKTAGTANTWKGNTGATANPAGILNN